jgi:mannosyltransferase OCH1-like enzyme
MDKNIIQVWFQGCKNITKKAYSENIKNWQLLNPEWKYHCLDNENLSELCTKFSPQCLAAYNKFDIMHVKIDLGKLVALYFLGGIMIDMDMYAFRSLDNSEIVGNIISYQDIFAIGRADSNTLESSVSGIYYNNAYIISNSGNKLLKMYIDTVIKKILDIKKNETFNNTMIVFETTGPKILSTFIDNAIKTGKSKSTNLVILPYHVFEPCNISGECAVKDTTVALHQFEMSWVNTGFTSVAKFYYNHVKKYVIYQIIIFALVVYIIFIFRSKSMQMFPKNQAYLVPRM